MKNLMIIGFLLFMGWKAEAQAMADFTYNQADPHDMTIQFTNTSQNASSYSWDLGDGTILPFFANAENPSHTYAATGTYTVCLTAKPLFGAQDQTCHDVVVVCPEPMADWTDSQPYAQYCTGEVNFENQSSGNYTSILWDFDDGTTSEEENPSHTYAVEGNYIVSLTVTNPCGSSTYYGSISVFHNEPPTYAVDGYSVIAYDPFYLKFESEFESYYGNIPNSGNIEWDFGDGTATVTTLIPGSPTHLFENPGTYNVCATATNECGSTSYCSDIAITCILPEASFFTHQGNSLLPIIQFTNTSLDNSLLGGITYEWDFGDNSSSTDMHPTHTYAAAGAYDVSLRVNSQYCYYDIFDTTIVVLEVMYVDSSATGSNDGTSWANAFTDLQSALAIGVDYEIRMAAGIYYPTSGISRAIFFDIPTGTRIEGGYPTGGGTRDIEMHRTVLSGDINYDNLPLGNSYHVIRLQDVADVTLDGLTIKGGNADNANSFARARGGGIYSTSADNTMINNCVIEDNNAVFGGGVFATLSPDFVIEQSIVQSNTANNGSALYHSNETTMYLYKTRIVDNNSLVRCAIEINNSSHTHIEQCLIANNASLNANAIGFIATNRNQTCTMYNNTILGETKNKYLITLQIGFNDVLDVNMYNTIFSHQNTNFNKIFKEYNNGTLNLNTTYCYVQGSTVMGNSYMNLYSETVGDLLLNNDYSLQDCSPGVDGGLQAIANSALESSLDIDGNDRTLNIVDLGAFESQTPCSGAREINDDGIKNSIGTTEFSVYPNPATDVLRMKIPVIDQPVEIRLVNVLGQEVKLIQTEPYVSQVEMQVSDLAIGQYWILFNDRNRQYSKQINIMR